METNNFLKILLENLKETDIKVIPAEQIEKIKPALADGSTGKLYKPRYQGNIVAAKQIYCYCMSEEVVDIFLEQTKIVAAVDHPDVSKFYGIWVKKDKLHFVFEFVDGPTLMDIYQKVGQREIGVYCCSLTNSERSPKEEYFLQSH